jgi:valyl-tRNA synthetase
MKIRYDTWINGLKWDWCISRQRYFGVPFPIWYCKKCGTVALAEDSQLPVDPLVTQPLHPCKKCGSADFEPEKDVMDTWATSSVTPLINANWGEPDSIIDKMYPMNLRPQSHEIIRTWLFYTVIKSYLHTKTLPWYDIMISGQGLDPNGKAMHKSKGNIVEPLPFVQKYSADAVRWWAASAKLGDDLAFKEKEIVYGQKFINKLFNASRFASIHLKDYTPREPDLELIDKWLLTKLNDVIRESTENFERYEYSKAKALTEQFFWGDFCDNYLEIAKDRLYKKEENGESGQAALYTVYTALFNSLKLLGPFVPHITEDIYQRMFRQSEGIESLHVSKWPEPNYHWADIEALKLGNMAVALISSLRQYKNSQSMAQNAVLSKVIISGNGLEADIQQLATVLKDTMKISEISYGMVERPDAVSVIGTTEIKMQIEK